MIPCNKFVCVHKKCTYAHTERQLATQLQYFEGIVNPRKELKKNVKSANNFKRIAKKIFPMVEQLHTNTQLQSTGKLLSFLQQTSVFTDKERGNMLKVMLDCQHEVSNKNKDAFPMPNQKTEPPVTTSFAAESSVFLVSPMKKNPPPGFDDNDVLCVAPFAHDNQDTTELLTNETLLRNDDEKFGEPCHASNEHMMRELMHLRAENEELINYYQKIIQYKDEELHFLRSENTRLLDENNDNKETLDKIQQLLCKV